MTAIPNKRAIINRQDVAGALDDLAQDMAPGAELRRAVLDDLVAVKRDTSNPAVLDSLKEGRVRNGLDRARACPEAVKYAQQDNGYDHPEDDVLGEIVQNIDSR